MKPRSVKFEDDLEEGIAQAMSELKLSRSAIVKIALRVWMSDHARTGEYRLPNGQEREERDSWD